MLALAVSCIGIRAGMFLKNATGGTIDVTLENGDQAVIEPKKSIFVMDIMIRDISFTVKTVSGVRWAYSPSNVYVNVAAYGPHYKRRGTLVVDLELRKDGTIVAVPAERGWPERVVLVPQQGRRAPGSLPSP